MSETRSIKIPKIFRASRRLEVVNGSFAHFLLSHADENIPPIVGCLKLSSFDVIVQQKFHMRINLKIQSLELI